MDYLFGDFWSTKLGDKPKLYIEEINIKTIFALFLYYFVSNVLKIENHNVAKSALNESSEG